MEWLAANWDGILGIINAFGLLFVHNKVKGQ